MSDSYTIKLQLNRIKEIPLEKYENDFTFIVNGERFRTPRIIADLLSPIISNSHFSDTTLDSYQIDTHYKGDFKHFINLANFSTNSVPEIELQFIYEIVQILGNNSIEFHDKSFDGPIINETIIPRLLHHAKNIPILTNECLSDEINYLSSHFSEICNEKEAELLMIPINLLEMVLSDQNIKLDSEDQLLSFITKLYVMESEYSKLFQYVDFLFVSSESISQFLSIFDINDVTQDVWIKLTNRLKQDIYQRRKTRFRQKGKQIYYEQNREFEGIFNYISHNRKINQEVEVTSSSKNEEDQAPQNILYFDDRDKYFFSDDGPEAWICFDFKNHYVIPTNYTIRKTTDFCHPKSWVIEGSNDCKSWVVLDEQESTSFLDANDFYTFTIKNQNETEFCYIRMRMTGPNSSMVSNCIIIDSFEFFGTYI